jgi:hypothetical protein
MNDVIERLYGALAAQDGDAMAACYTADARFEDPVFGILEGDRVGHMWRMLTEASTGVEVDLGDVVCDGPIGSASWTARYVFQPTGRMVVNRGSARFRFRNRLIAEHRDDFSFYGWARQALGGPAVVFAWTPMARASVQKRARAGLERYIAARE